MAKITKHTTAEEFFEKLVPEQFLELADDLSDAQRAVSTAVGIKIDGDDGGSWTLRFDAGDFSVVRGLEDDANPVVAMHLEHWRSALIGDAGFMEGSVDDVDIDLSKLKPTIADRVKMIKGVLAVVIDDDGDHWRVTVGFGQDVTDEPTTTIFIDGDIAEQLRDNKLDPMAAFTGGKVKIQGDMNLAMQVASLSMI